eukprot:CAMPEP_0184865496 /NCGR_PEP_ID=MMETSP0580-20130426/18328_1 /TAXON_ID=1118495 /ORGANISM="Dactyliosolen fragilissimus" /LENGTH=709 /DNA_ID=CAMNT_0027364727 /DNA_START=64 /DNA_END=2193 /DNA_ORIENTATION=-
MTSSNTNSSIAQSQCIATKDQHEQESTNTIRTAVVDNLDVIIRSNTDENTDENNDKNTENNNDNNNVNNNNDKNTENNNVNNNNDNKNNQADKNASLYALSVKQQFVLTERSSILADVTAEEEREPRVAGGRKKNRHKHNIESMMANVPRDPCRGISKSNIRRKREHDQLHNSNSNASKEDGKEALNSIAIKMCKSILTGNPESCPFGEKCKFSHDLKEALACRPPDIQEVTAGCPHYNLWGKCPHGISCRVGSSHLNLATGKNLTKEIDGPAPPTSVNVLSKNTQIMLRKKKYVFKCKRHFEHKQSHNCGTNMDNHHNNNDVQNLTNKKVNQQCKSNNTPYPTKTRKLIDFSKKVYVAPLTTVGNLPFRRILKQYGADITCGEMAVATNLLEGKSGEWALLRRHPDEDIFGVQIAAGHADQFTRACEVIHNECEVDFVDMNLGCPIDVICDKGAGAKLMLRENKLKESLRGITSTLQSSVTVKIRTGWDENKPFAHKLVPKIQSWGIDGIAAIMLHGRSRLQRYTKLADWDYIQKVALSQNPDLPRIPIIGNGDILSYVDYEEKIKREGVNTTAMIARGALIKPWLPTEIKERRHWDISASERLDILKNFVQFGLEHWGSDQQGVNNTRRFLLEWLSFLYRYVPVGILEVLPQGMNERPPVHMCGRSDLETLMLSKNCADWIKISEMLLGKVPDGFRFTPKHKANSYK